MNRSAMKDPPKIIYAIVNENGAVLGADGNSRQARREAKELDTWDAYGNEPPRVIRYILSTPGKKDAISGKKRK